jgi:hypothetical protein
MKLIELNPRWIGSGGEGVFKKKEDGTLEPAIQREGVAIGFNCPCGCESKVCIHLENPIDGGPPLKSQNLWRRTGEAFETLTLHPSLQRVDGCKSHFLVKNGEIVNT